MSFWGHIHTQDIDPSTVQVHDALSLPQTNETPRGVYKVKSLDDGYTAEIEDMESWGHERYTVDLEQLPYVRLVVKRDNLDITHYARAARLRDAGTGAL